MTEYVFCKDCVHCNHDHRLFWECTANKLPNLLTGEPGMWDCWSMRNEENKCGQSGKWFEKKQDANPS